MGVRLLLDNRRQDRVMDNFGCQQLGCLDIWSNIILVVSMRLILDEINAWISRLRKQIALPYVCVCVCEGGSSD